MGALSSRSSTPAGNATKGALKPPLTATGRAAHARKWAATAKSGVLTAVLVGDEATTKAPQASSPLTRCQGAPGKMSGVSREPFADDTSHIGFPLARCHSTLGFPLVLTSPG